MTLGHANLGEDYYYSLYVDKAALLQESITMIRGWSYKILSAYGNFLDARLEYLRDRGYIPRIVPTLTETEIRK